MRWFWIDRFSRLRKRPLGYGGEKCHPGRGAPARSFSRFAGDAQFADHRGAGPNRRPAGGRAFWLPRAGGAGQSRQGEFPFSRRARRHADLSHRWSKIFTRTARSSTAPATSGDRLQAEVELFFVHLDENAFGSSLFDPPTLLQMLKLLGMFTVGRTTDGKPLAIPAGAGLAAQQHHGGRSSVCKSDLSAAATFHPLFQQSGSIMRRRVVVTGVGFITPMGTEVEQVWSGLKEGASGVGYTSIFDASSFPTKISAEVRDWDVSDVGEDPEVWRLRGRHTKFAAGAAKKAVRDSGAARQADRSHPIRRLPGKRRRPAGFSLLHAR